MKFLMWLCLIHGNILASQTFSMSKIRSLYCKAPLIKSEAKQLHQLMLNVNTTTAAPVLVCYKGASKMIDAKYVFNPIIKFADFNKGKEMISKAISRDTLNLEMRFIRYSIQSNLPFFLGYNDDLKSDKRFLLANSRNSKDTELKEMIFNYFSTSSVIKKEELKQLKN